MRKYARTDANQKKIATALRYIGATVKSAASLGDGFPDLVVGYRGNNYLLEVKDGDKPPSKQALTPDEELFHRTWAGTITVVNSIDSALKAIGITV